MRQNDAARTSNVAKFLAACSLNLGLSSEDLFLLYDLTESSPESLARVSRTVITLVETSKEPPRSLRARGLHERHRDSDDRLPLSSSPPTPSPWPSNARYSLPLIMNSPPQVDLIGGLPNSKPPGSALRSRSGHHKNFPILPGPLPLSDALSIPDDTSTLPSLQDSGYGLSKKNLHSEERESPSTITKAAIPTVSFSPTPSILPLNYEYHVGEKRSGIDSGTSGLLDGGLGETPEIDQVAEGVRGDVPGVVDRLGPREKSSSKDSPSRPQRTTESGKVNLSDDIPPHTFLCPGPAVQMSNAPARNIVRYQNPSENNTIQLILSEEAERNRVITFVSTFVSVPVP